ncbi:glycerate 2-kinase [Rhizobium sp. SG_E_25_P2]|uniref:glycerate kinase type-2 family protein n=1 Tax=Rhizobium sp. SG_E_25_P2 TaxID=2879942 RepID=UPI00247724C7|nr:glycerate kinase [Rhizobium sp. SG_E_25_P2]MDH6265855.1 glycerate 2-kinase [Rhizobium sp. SG_E_25_P2]
MLIPSHDKSSASVIEHPRDFLKRLFERAVEVADPMRSLAGFLPPKPDGRILVVGAGKASARMAEAVEAAWGPCNGLVITRYGYGRPCQGVEIVQAAHPVPDEAGLRATARMLDLVRSAGENDFVLALISGGASALLVQPVDGVTLEEKQAVNQALLASGAPIDRMNTVRKHLSRVKGGQLAVAAYPAHMLALLISDVPGDDPAFIGSGPTVGDSSTPADARAALERWRVAVPPSVECALNRATGVMAPGDPKLSCVDNVIVAAPRQSLDAAADLASRSGCEVRMLGDALEGEARDVAILQARQALEIRASMRPGDAPVLLLSGGELTVTRRGAGVGGPNAEFCLALALALNGAPGIHALACDTDGVDGAAEVAGAVVDPATLALAAQAGLDAGKYLAENDAHSFFQAVGGQIVTGPTLTNVNDFRAILIEPALL